MFDSIILPAVVSLTMTLLVLWFKSYLTRREERSSELHKRTQEAFQQLLEWHSDLFLSHHVTHDTKPQMTEDMIRMGKKISMWGSDDVVYHYAQALALLTDKVPPKLSNYERELAEAILAFRKHELNFANRRLTPEHIMTIFRGGRDINLV